MMSMTMSGMTKQFWPLLIVPNDSCFHRHDSYSSCAQVLSVGGIGAFGFSVYVIQLALQSFQATVGINHFHHFLYPSVSNLISHFITS